MEGDWVSEAQLRHPCRYVHSRAPRCMMRGRLRSHAIPSTKKAGKTGEGGGAQADRPPGRARKAARNTQPRAAYLPDAAVADEQQLVHLRRARHGTPFSGLAGGGGGEGTRVVLVPQCCAPAYVGRIYLQVLLLLAVLLRGRRRRPTSCV